MIHEQFVFPGFTVPTPIVSTDTPTTEDGTASYQTTEESKFLKNRVNIKIIIKNKTYTTTTSVQRRKGLSVSSLSCMSLYWLGYHNIPNSGLPNLVKLYQPPLELVLA